MKKLLAIATALGIMIIPFVAYGLTGQTGPVGTQPEQTATKAPPVSEQLIPEGDFALKLATALKLGTPEMEAQAEDMLASVGIAPKNGWIADYPMTPIIIGQVRNAVVAAAALKKLLMRKDEALQAFDGLTAEFGIAIGPAPGQYAETPPTGSEYVPPPDIENYYYEQGPPVVTYYPPPWDYYYLYGWVPYPFFCAGFFFPGFFILNDFHHFHHGHHLISNHFFDPKTHASLRVDPTTRTRGITATRAGGGFRSPEANRGAASIFNRSANARTFRPNFQGSWTGAGRSFRAPSMRGRSSFGGFRGGGFGSRGSGGGGGRGHR
jgi:hypothetical protein